MRPGIMIGGRVVMAPSRVITFPATVEFLPKVQVMFNGVRCVDVVAYDEDQGMLVNRHGQVVTGHVHAIPRPVKD